MNYQMKFLFRKIVLCVAFLALLFSTLDAQIPQRPNPPRLVNDFVGLFSPEQAGRLEQKLRVFNDSSSTQITVVVVREIVGDKADMAYQIGRQWGVGQKGKNNGIVILLKPKTADSKGQAFIASGYGLEGAVPDAICKRIVENEMIPHFKEGDYYGGVDASVNVLIKLTKGEFTADQYAKKSKKSSTGGIVFLAIIMLVIFVIISKARSHSIHNQSIGGGGGAIPFWLLLSMMNSGTRSGGGSYSDFSSGSGGFSDFGGFGGGDFGGGGAGGDW
jgi:uncharacterized protein